MKERSSLEKIVSNVKKFIAGALVLSVPAFNPSRAAEITNLKIETPIESSVGTTNYYTTTITNADSSIETRAYKDDHHFMSFIEKDGCVAIRLAAGEDVDRWSSSFYPHAFLPGAVLKGLKTKSIAPFGNDRIQMSLEGTVSKGNNETFGKFFLDMYFQHPNKGYIYGQGIGLVRLDAPLSTVNVDLNLFKVASNYLDDVPKLDGTIGDTGDTKEINVRGWRSNNMSVYEDFVWNPSTQPAHFPQDLYQRLSISLPPQYNDVDTVRQGYAPIKAAFKSGLSVTISGFNNQAFIFGGLYNTYESKNFWSDNVGITPLVLKNDPSTNIMYNIYMSSVRHEAESLQDEVTLIANGNPGLYAGVFYTPDLAYSFKRIATLPFQNGKYTGTAKVSPEMLGFYNKKDTGFFKVIEEQ